MSLLSKLFKKTVDVLPVETPAEPTELQKSIAKYVAENARLREELTRIEKSLVDLHSETITATKRLNVHRKQVETKAREKLHGLGIGL